MSFLVGNHLTEEKRAGCFTLNYVLTFMWVSSNVASSRRHGLLCDLGL